MKKVSFLRRSCHFPKPDVAWIEAYAAMKEIPFADVVRRAVSEFIDRQDKLVPRQSKPKDPPPGQNRMPLEGCTS